MRISLAALFLLLCALTVSASHLDGIDPPVSLLVERNGYQWAWVSPCAPEDPSCGVPLIMHHNFVIASRADWLRDFTGVADIYAAFHPGGSQLCATPYFNSGYDHCDSVNIDGGGGSLDITIWNAPWGVGNRSYSESFAVRSVIPEPATWALLGAGLAVLGARARRRN